MHFNSLAEQVRDYKELKTNILDSIGEISAQDVKGTYENEINSTRTFASISSLSELIRCLDERDFISEGNLTYLESILKYLSENNRLNDIDDLVNEITYYQKKYETNKQCICNLDVIAVPIFNVVHKTVPIIPSAPPLEQVTKKNSSEIKLEPELESLFSYISERIGKDWRHFLSELKLKEKTISEIATKPGISYEQAALEALSAWRKQTSRKTAVKELIQQIIDALRTEGLYYQNELAMAIENEEY